MAKQIMIRDDIAGKLDKIREERSCSYSAVIDELISERDENAPERAKDFFTAAFDFEESLVELVEYIGMLDEDDPRKALNSALKNEKGIPGFRETLKNYLTCADLIKNLSEKDVEEHREDLYYYLDGEWMFFHCCKLLEICKLLGPPEMIFPASKKKKLEGISNEELESLSLEDLNLSLLV